MDWDSGDPRKRGEALVEPILKHWSTSTGHGYLDEQRLIVMYCEASSEAVYFMTGESLGDSGFIERNWSIKDAVMTENK